MESTAGAFLQLQQTPPIAVEVFQDDHGPIGVPPWRLLKTHSTPFHRTVVTPEVIGVQKKKHATPVWLPIRLTCRS